MNKLITLTVLVIIALFAALAVHNSACAATPAKDEIRYCFAVKDIARDAHGVIKRDKSVLAAFQKVHPCPATKQRSGACPGWAINHVIPLAVGGCDAVWNMQWMPDAIKSCALPTCEDRFERTIYAPEFGL